MTKKTNVLIFLACLGFNVVIGLPLSLSSDDDGDEALFVVVLYLNVILPLWHHIYYLALQAVLGGGCYCIFCHQTTEKTEVLKEYPKFKAVFI